MIFIDVNPVGKPGLVVMDVHVAHRFQLVYYAFDRGMGGRRAAHTRADRKPTGDVGTARIGTAGRLVVRASMA